MHEIAIRVENLSKQYRIGRARQRHDTLRDAIAAAIQRSHVRTCQRANAETLWALKDVSFEVARGEVVGIIGRNGAGKTTLLKILSRITEPTSGRAILHGRVGSLLEVGTGFHPELTGRENIYLSGAVLGMRKAEIEGKFDEMVAFAEIEKFLDTPVKRYSSGMRVRLGFAVAAHLDPGILLVDEVLAVGDAAFQKKCLGKMDEVAGEGRTVLYVSHNMAAVKALCERGICIADGSVRFDGDAVQCVSRYAADTAAVTASRATQFPIESACGSVRIDSARLQRDGGDLLVCVQIHSLHLIQSIGLGFAIQDSHNGLVSSQGAIHSGAYANEVLGDCLLTLRLINLAGTLTGGEYHLSIWLARPGGHKYVEIPDLCTVKVPHKLPRDGRRVLSLEKNGPVFISTRFKSRQLAKG